MRTREGEFCRRVMVKLGALPSLGCVTQRTILGKIGGDVARIRCLREVDHMASGAIRWCPFEDIVDVTLGTSEVYVRAGQRKLRSRIVVEFRTLPLGRVVAERTILRKPGGNMIRIPRLVEIGHVAALTVGGRPLEHIVHVALRACEVDVSSRQGEFRHGIVIELRAGPGCRVVAQRAILGESCSGVTRIHALVVIRKVARDAG